VSHGTLKNAQVFLDVDSDGVLDWVDGNANNLWDAGEGEQWALTDADGNYTLANVSAADKASGTLVVKSYTGLDSEGNNVSTLDTISGSAVENIVMKATAASVSEGEVAMITPLTTLVAAGISGDDVLEILGLDASIDIDTFDPFASLDELEGADLAAAEAKALAFEKVATKLFTTVNTIAEAIDSSAGDDLDATEGFILAIAEVATKIGEEVAVRAANTAIGVEAAALRAEADALQAIVVAAGDDVTAEQTAAVTAKEVEVTVKVAEVTAEQDLDLTDATTIAAITNATVTAADTQIKAVKTAEEAVLQAEADALQAIVVAAGDDVTAEQTAAVTAKEVEVTAKNIEATTDKVGDSVTALVTSVSQAVVNVNTEIDSLTAFDTATAKDTLNLGADTLATQVKAAVESAASISLAADTFVTLSEDDTSLSFTAVTGTATSGTGFYGDISNDSGSSWTYTLHTMSSHGQAQSEGDRYTEEFVITDINGVENSVTVVVYGADDAAVITAADSTIAEGTATVSATATHTDVDSDDDANSFIVVSSAIDSANGYGTYTVTQGGIWTYNLTNDHATIDALGDGESASDTITVTAGDGTTEDIVITITGTNDAPVFTSEATASAPENGLAAAIITATDVDDEQLDYAITGGTDQALFSLDPSTGVLTFVIRPDYELTNPVADDNTYNLTVSASDGDVTVEQEVTITVTNVEGGPVFSSAATVAVDENQTAVFNLTASDDENDVIAFTITGGDDAGSFTLTDGVLIFKEAPNYEAKASYALTVTASETADANGNDISEANANTTEQEIVVSIEDINDAAVITAADDTIAEGTATVSATATHTDADTGNDDNTFLAVTDVASTYGTYSVTGAGVWTYALTSEHATIDALSDGESTTDTITVTAEDLTTEDVTITITGTNDAAVIAGTSTGAVTEDDATTTATGTLTHTDVDANNDANVFTAVSSAIDSAKGYGTYTMTGGGGVDGGVWTYTIVNTNTTVSALTASQTTTDSFTVTSEDGTPETVTVTITGVNDAPVATADSFTLSEDAAATVLAVLGNDTDAEGDVLTVTAKGTPDKGGTATLVDGVLTYTPAANFSGTETITYQIEDENEATANATATVTVTPVNDDPTGSVTISGTAKTGQTLTASNDLADVDGIGVISYQWANADGDISGATDSTYVLSDSDIGSTITATASYTDSGATAETKTSDATVEVTDIVKLIQIRNIESVTLSEASVSLYGVDGYSSSTDKFIKFDIYLDAEGVNTLSDSGLATELIAGSFDLGWSNSELQTISPLKDSTDFFLVDDTYLTMFNNLETGGFSFLNTTVISGPVVDTDPSNDTSGFPPTTIIPMEQLLATVYVNQVDSATSAQLSIENISIGTNDVDVAPLDYTIDLL
jgi:VCBS repeat-containing protein